MENKTLSPKATDYLRIMQSKYLVLNLIGPPGTAKSAILKHIADANGFEFIDLRLATMDETDLGVYPYLMDRETYKVNAHAVPEWADRTRDTTKTFVICFEELNRASKAVRDAALGVLLERRIGENFIFGDNVLMCSTGNLGVLDGTEVEELDTALKSRLITVEHNIPLDEWIKYWAKDHVHPDIIRYLEQEPTDFYPDIKSQDNGGRVIVNPRTWTGLSAFLLTHYGKDSTVDAYGSEMDRIAKHYIGSYGLKWLKWLRDNMRVTALDIIEGSLVKTKAGVKLMGKRGQLVINEKGQHSIERENLNEICSNLKAIGVTKISKEAMERVVKLLQSVDEDIKYGTLWDLSITHDGITEKFPGPRLMVETFGKELKKLAAEKNNQTAAK